MGTIPVAPTFATEVLAASKLNQYKTLLDFLTSPPRCNAFRTAALSLPSGSYTAIPWDAEDLDVVQSGDSPMHDNVTNPTRIHARTPGRYEIGGQITFDTASGSTRRVRVRLNSAGSGTGGTQLLETTQDPVSGYYTAVAIPAIEYQMAAGDYIEVFAYHVVGSSVALITGYGVSFVRMKLVAS